MHSKLTVAAATTFGVGVGALLGWAVTADYYDRRIRDDSVQWTKLMQNKTQHIWALQDRLEFLTALEEPVEVVQALEDDADEEDLIPEGETPEETRSNLQKLIDMYTSDSDTQFENLLTPPVANTDRETPPFVISKSDYAWDDEGDSYSKITLTYFPRERVLLDDDDEPIEDIARMVGWRNLTRFGDESEDPEVVFVRNRRMETDFEIVKEDDAPLPLHVKYGMEKEEFRASKAAGLIRLRQEDE